MEKRRTARVLSVSPAGISEWRLAKRLRRAESANRARVARGRTKGSAPDDFLYAKRVRERTGLAVSRALYAAGFDPKDEKDRKVRADVHRMMQNVIDLGITPLRHSDGNSAYSLGLAESGLYTEILAKISASKGPGPTARFREAWSAEASKIAELQLRISEESDKGARPVNEQRRAEDRRQRKGILQTGKERRSGLERRVSGGK